MSDTDLTRLRNLLDETAASGENRLPAEPQLSAALGVTRGRLRTLLGRLESEGAIWRHVGKGTFIGPRNLPDIRLLSTSFSVGDIFDARMALEPQIAASAALRATSEDIAILDECIGQMRAPESFLHWKRLDERLHREIAKAAHNELLLTLYDTLRAQMRPTLDQRLEQVFGAEPGPKSDADVAHLAVIDAIRAHDTAGAEEAMRGHLRSIRDKLFGWR